MGVANSTELFLWKILSLAMDITILTGNYRFIPTFYNSESLEFINYPVLTFGTVSYQNYA